MIKRVNFTGRRRIAAKLLAKLLEDEIKTRSARNLVQSRQFSEMPKKTLNAYHSRAIATQEVIEELIKLANEMDTATKHGIDLGLNDDEIAFYDALAANESAVKAMGNAELTMPQSMKNSGDRAVRPFGFRRRRWAGCAPSRSLNGSISSGSVCST